MLLCGLAIDSGLLYLAKARMSRAVDGAALAAIGNFNRNPDPYVNRDDVALIMRNFAVANFTSLAPIGTSGSSTSGGTPTTTTGSNGKQTTSYTYNFNDTTQDANGQYRRFVQVTLNTGAGGAITSATCNARCPVQTYFIGYGWYFLGGGQSQNYAKIGGYSGPSGLVDLKVSSSAVATRNPRLIMVVIDRSASMLATPGGGATGLAPAVVEFLDFFDTSSDNIGIVSFGSSARLEMPMTTNFIVAGTNNLIDAYETNVDINGNSCNTPGVDPESDPTRTVYDPNYNSTGVRRMKFGGDTAADEGIRLALEQMMASPGFTDPDVVKYLVLFTDGAWNASRSLFAAPGYTNEVTAPSMAQVPTPVYVTNLYSTAYGVATPPTNGQEYVPYAGHNYYGPWLSDVTTNASESASLGAGANSNLLLMPTLSPLAYVTNAMVLEGTNDYSGPLAQSHYQDTWLSADGTSPADNTQEPLPSGHVLAGGSGWITGGTTGTGPITTTTSMGGTYYTHNIDLWLQPGAVAYLYHSNSITHVVALSNSGVYVSDYTEPTKHINIYLAAGDKIDLVVPGYIVDGVVYDGLDLNYPDNSAYGTTSGFTKYRADNYQVQYSWPDDQGGTFTDANGYGNYYTASLMRQLMFRNYANLLTGFYLFRPDEPLAPYVSGNPVGSQGVEPLITDSTNSAGATGAPRARYGLGAYYPSAGFYWPFGGDATNAAGYITDAVGIDQDKTYGLRDPVGGGGSDQRFIAYSLNMLSTNAAPEWSGELFYKSSSGGGTNSTAGTGNTAVSQIMTSSDWQNGAPAFVTAMGTISGLMSSDATHNTNITPNPSVWRPACFNGSAFTAQTSINNVTQGGTSTGGWVYDGNGHYYPNAMAWSGRPTHYYDFSKASWEPIPDNHVKNNLFLQIGNWKAEEYAWHARALGVTIYTVGYGSYVNEGEQAFLAQLANATNTTAGGGSNMPYNPSQPIGAQFYATTPDQISNDFYQVGQAINAALTQ